MKKLYFLLTIFLFSKTIAAQQYFPMLDSVNEWHYVGNFIPVRMEQPAQIANLPCSYPPYYGQTLIEFTTHDTVINAMTYKVVNALQDGNSYSCTFGYVREDTALKKVFFIDNVFNPEVVLYDFSMQVGNTMTINFVQSGNFFYTGVFTLDSITTVHIQAGNRRAFHLNNHAHPGSYTLTWVESMGNYYDAFYPYSQYAQGNMMPWWNCTIFPHENIGFMTCFDHMGKVYYDSCAYHEAFMSSCFNTLDTCDYYDICGGVNEIPSFASMTIFPNPSYGKTTISIDVKRAGDFEIFLRDISGKKIMKEVSLGKISEGQKDVEMDLTSFANGFYIVELKSAEGSVYRKLLIQH
jgi:hypothetical protein